MTSRKFHKLFGSEPRKSESKLTQFHMDLASSVQNNGRDCHLLKIIKKETNSENLCLAGGRFKLCGKW